MSRRITWTAPDGIARNQIDYILIDKKCASSINGHKTRSFPGADIGSDHNLVMLTMKLKLKRIKKTPQTRMKYGIEKLKDPEVHEAFCALIGGKFAPLMELDETQEMTEKFTEVMNEAVMKILGKERRKKQPILEKCIERPQSSKMKKIILRNTGLLIRI